MVESINIRAEAHRKRKDAAEWLNDALTIVRGCYDNGRATLQPFLTEKLNSPVEPPLQLFAEELDAAGKHHLCLIVDDRLCSSYYKVATKEKPSYIFTTYDIVCLLHSEKVLSDSEFYNLIDRLISDKYCFFVPPAGYLMSRLYFASVSEAGTLNETEILGALRRLISFAVESEAGLSAAAVNSSQIPEVGGFLAELHQELNQCLRLVWASDKETEWKEAVSEWLLTYLGDFICDSGKLHVDVEYGLSIELSSLFLNCFFQKSLNPERAFVQWVSSKVIVPWTMSGDILRKSAQSLCETLSSLNEPSDDNGPQFEFFSKVAHQFKLKIFSSAPSIMRRELLKTQMFSEFEEMPGCSGVNGSDISQQVSVVEDDCSLNLNGVLSGNCEALEKAIMFACTAPDSNIELLLRGIAEDGLEKVPTSTMPVLCKFLLDLSWYAPANKRRTIFMLKRKLAMLF